MRKHFLLIFVPILVFSCPKKEELFKKLQNLKVPVKEINYVKPSGQFKGLCEVEGIFLKGKKTFRSKFYTTEDGKYLIPFIGKIEMVPSKVLKGWKEIRIRSLRNSNNTLKIGFTNGSGKFYIPEIFEAK